MATKITHLKVWQAIDQLADDHGYSPSGLARAAGLDPVIFNKSKRHAVKTGKPRWPTMQTIAKILDVTDESLEAFARRVTQRRRR